MFRDLIDLIGGGEPIEDRAFAFVDAGGLGFEQVVPLAGVIFESGWRIPSMPLPGVLG